MSSADDVSFKVGTVKVRVDVSKSSGNSDPIPPILKDNNGATVVKLKNFNGTICVSDNQRKRSSNKLFGKQKNSDTDTDENTKSLHELYADPDASLDEIRLAMNKDMDSIHLPDVDGKLPIHYLSLNNLFYERSREEVDIIASDLLNYFPKSILHPDYSGHIPFSESITSWVKGIYDQIKTPGSYEERMNNIIPESVSVPALVEWAFMFFSDVLDQCSQEMRNEIASCIVGIPYLVKTVLLISDNNEMYKILDCSLFRRVILHPETIGCWFLTMLKTDKVKALRVVQYFEMLDSSKIIHYIGKRKEPTPSDLQFFQENRAEIFNRITSQKELIPALFNLSTVDIRRVALTKVVQEALEMETFDPFLSNLMRFDFILHLTLLYFIREIAMFNGVLVSSDKAKYWFECSVCQERVFNKFNWNFNYNNTCGDLNCGRTGEENKPYVESIFLHFVVAFCICGYFIFCREITNCVALTKVSYTAYTKSFANPWRVSQLTSVVMSTIMAIICFLDAGKDNLSIPLSITVFLLWFSLFYYLIIYFKPISIFLFSTLETMKSTSVFYCVLFITIVAFGDIFNINWTNSNDCPGMADRSTEAVMNNLTQLNLDAWEESIKNYGKGNPFCSARFGESYFYMYSVVLSMYDIEYFKSSVYDKLMFILFSVITMFILLNCLAATVIESHQKLKSKVESIYGAVQINFLAGNLALLSQLDNYGEQTLTQGYGINELAKRTTLFLAFLFLFSFLTIIVFALVFFEASIIKVKYGTNPSTSIEYHTKSDYSFALIIFILQISFLASSILALLTQAYRKLIHNTDNSMRKKFFDRFAKININIKDEGDVNDWSGRVVEIERFTRQTVMESEVRINQNIMTAQSHIIADACETKSELEMLIKNSVASLSRKKKKTPLVITTK